MTYNNSDNTPAADSQGNVDQSVDLESDPHFSKALHLLEEIGEHLNGNVNDSGSVQDRIAQLWETAEKFGESKEAGVEHAMRGLPKFSHNPLADFFQEAYERALEDCMRQRIRCEEKSSQLPESEVRCAIKYLICKSSIIIASSSIPVPRLNDGTPLHVGLSRVAGLELNE